MDARKIIYRPPYSDSEDDYEGFSFGDELERRKDWQSPWMVDVDKKLFDAVFAGDLDEVKQQVLELNFNVNAPVRGGFTLLLYACKEGYVEIVRYLLDEKRADPNRQIDSITPLFLACDCTKETHLVDKMVDLLLKHGAVINVADKYGLTPFMMACKNGHASVVHRLLPHSSLEAIDNDGCTPIFYAIEKNHAAIVQMLVDEGVNTKIANNKGYTPLQVAQFHGFYDLLDILPKEREMYLVPSTFMGYNTLRDCIPRIFLKSECPEYFQEIFIILQSMNMDHFLEYFAKERVSLAQFLCITDDGLQQVGIYYPLFRAKILKGLLDFHLNHWSKKTIAKVNKTPKESFYQTLMITANHLQQLVVINSTLRYINNNLRQGLFGNLTLEQLQGMMRDSHAYNDILGNVMNLVKYHASFSPRQSPLYIDYNEYLSERKRRKLKCYFKYTTLVVGISIFICFKVKSLF